MVECEWRGEGLFRFLRGRSVAHTRAGMSGTAGARMRKISLAFLGRFVYFIETRYLITIL